MVHKVSIQQISENPSCYQVFIDNVPFGDRVTDVQISMGVGETNKVVLTMPFQTLEVNDIDAEVNINNIE